MKIVSVWNPKGGQGKSTLSINIAAAAVNLGLKPIIIDRDEQGTSMLFYKGGCLPFEVLPDYPKKAPNVDLIILDHMASDRDIPRSPLIVIPFLPVRSQYAHYLEALKKAQSSNKRIISIVTNGHTQRKSETEIINAVKKSGTFEIKSNATFSKADQEYRTVFDPKFNTSSNVKRTRNELISVVTAILQNLENEPT